MYGRRAIVRVMSATARGVPLPLLLLVSLGSSQAATVCFPQIADGGGYTTTVTIVNPQSVAVTATLAFYGQKGSPRILTLNGVRGSQFSQSIPGLGTTRFRTLGEGPTLSSWASLDSDFPVQAVATFDLRSATGVPQSIVGIMATRPSRRFVMPFELGPQVDPGIAIANVSSSSPVTMRFHLLSQTGVEIDAITSEPFAPRTQIADFISTRFHNLPSGSFTGSLIGEVVEEGEVAVTALVVDRELLTAIPVNDMGPTLFNNLLILYSDTNVTYARDGETKSFSGTMNESFQTAVVDAFQSLSILVSDGSAGYASAHCDVARIGRPITKISNLAGNYYWLSDSDVQADLAEYAPPGRYDAVHIVWNNGPIDGYWGLGGMSINGGKTNFSSYIAGSEFWWSDKNVAQLFLHEWLHGICGFYQSLGFAMPKQDADGGSAHGYSESPTEGWMAYYRDLMQRRVWEPELSKCAGVTREAWTRCTPNAYISRW